MLSRGEQETACYGKQPYDTAKQVYAILNRRKRRDRMKWDRQVAYKCLYCGKWHLGTALRKDARKIIRKRR